MNKYFYPIYKSNLKPWIKYWLIKKTSVKPVTGTYTRATGTSPLTILKALKAPIRDLNLYGDCYQEQRASKNLFIGYSNATSGWLPGNGSYPTTSGSYPNAKYQLLELKEGESITISNSTSTQSRIRYIDKPQDVVVGTITSGENLYYISTASFDNGFQPGTITAKRDFIVGILLMTESEGYSELMIQYGTEATSYEPYNAYHPSPTNPSEVQTITGNTGIGIQQGLSISYKPIRLGSIELCKIGDYVDRIFKAPDNKWYLEKNIGKKVFTGSSSEGTWSKQTGYYQCSAGLGSISSAGALCDHYVYGELNVVNNFTITTNAFRVNDSTDTLDNYKTWLGTHNVTLYYVLSSAVVTEITGVNLLNDLEAASSIETFKGSNEITFSDLSPNISFEYLKEDEV